MLGDYEVMLGVVVRPIEPDVKDVLYSHRWGLYQTGSAPRDPAGAWNDAARAAALQGSLSEPLPWCHGQQ
jgi:hypothetical protein